MTLSADGTYTHIAYGGISASGKGTWSFDGKILVKTATGETEQESAGSELLNMSADQFQILVAPKMMLTWQRSR